MDWYKGYRLVKDGDGYIIEIYLNKDSNEFSREFTSNFKNNLLKLDDKIKNFVDEKFSNIKINSVKLIMGSLIVASIPFASIASAHAADAAPVSTGTVTASKLNVRSGPSTGYSVIHALWNGNQVKVIGNSGNWYKIQLSDGRTGWVSRTYLKTNQTVSPSQTEKLNTTGTVTADKLNVRSGPSTGYSVIHALWNGNRVKIIGQSGAWYNIRLSDGRTGWVSKNYMKADSSTQTDTRQQKIDKVISTAKSLIGTPYVWGGESLAEGGFDCSGFTQYAFKQAGYQLNRISADQAKQGSYVSRTSLQPGDLIFHSFSGNGVINHVGIYIGNGQMIHSPKTGDVVKITSINTSYWQTRYVTARRII